MFRAVSDTTPHAPSVSPPITIPNRIAHRVNEFNVVAAIIAENPVVGLLPRCTGLPDAYRDRIALREIDGLTLGRHIDILTRSESLSRRSVRITIGWLRGIVQDQVAAHGVAANA